MKNKIVPSVQMASAQLAAGLALSRDKKAIRKLAHEGQVITEPQDLLKEPYMPSKEDLKQRLMEWAREEEEE